MFDLVLILLVPLIVLIRIILSKHHSIYLYLLGLIYIYGLAPYLFYKISNPFYLKFCEAYCVFGLQDLRFGFLMVCLMLIPLIIIEFVLYKNKTETPANITFINSLDKNSNLKILYFLFFFINIFGVYLYGFSDFFRSYVSADSNNIGGPAWSIMTNSFFFIALLYGNIGTKFKTVNVSFLALVSVYLFAGARLIPVMSLLFLATFWYGPNFRFNLRILLFIVLFCVSFVIIGAFRSSDNGLLVLANGFLEFGFVPTGYYNAVSLISPLQLNFFEFLVTTFRVLPGLPFDRKEEINLVANLYENKRLFSPIGGSYAITSLYIYFGFLSYLIFGLLLALLMLFDRVSYIKFVKSPSIKTQIVRSFFSFIAIFAMVNLIRNNYYSFISISVKCLFIHFLLLVNFKKFKI